MTLGSSEDSGEEMRHFPSLWLFTAHVEHLQITSQLCLGIPSGYTRNSFLIAVFSEKS